MRHDPRWPPQSLSAYPNNYESALFSRRNQVIRIGSKTTRGLLPKYGRHSEDIKFVQGLSFVVGSTEEEAARKSQTLDEAIDAEAMIAHLGGAMGVELDAYALDHPLSDIQTEGVRSILDWVQASVVGRKATVRDLGILNSRSSRVTGAPEQIAQQLAMWQAAGVDGINVINGHDPGELYGVH